MGRKPKHYPSFFKVLMNDFASKLRIPRDFVIVRNLEGKLPAKALIKDRNYLHWWTVKVKKTGEKNHYSFMRSGWRKFVRDCELKERDFLVFKLISNSVFEIVRYAPNGCEKDLMSNPIIEPQDSVSEQIKINPAKARKTRSRKSKEAEALPHPSSRRTSGRVAEASGSQEQTKHPNFKVVIKKHHRSCLVNQLCDSLSLSLVLQTLPKDFVRATGMAKKRCVTLRNEEGKEWGVEICLRTYPTSHGRIDLREGWSDFWKQNKIVYGDSCLFKFIKGAGNVVDVVVQKRGRG
ncbi:hypothetical protein RHGRI_023479 [Rhododendron griersonianum]|uniref:TF-B3 domain-containing protein n=1 Tax=Rhododendron griersonianum TaxID=479676 RepID=A0AAV6JAS3_9ERIC|nr:hypothetical protein RHGRI_023479 [Rhododendron griersonianum]